MATIEKRLESKFVAWCRAQNIEPIKGPVATSKGFPDRFLQLPKNGGTIYVEFKGSSDYWLTPLQIWWSEYLCASNPNRYFIVDTDVDLENLKAKCVQLMLIGDCVVAYEKALLGEECKYGTDSTAPLGDSSKCVILK